MQRKTFFLPHSKKFWNAKINICMLHGEHLQICFSEFSFWMFSVRYPTWLNCHLKISICNDADCVILWGGGRFRIRNMEYCKIISHMKSIEMKLEGLWCMIGDKKEIEKIIKANEKLAPGGDRTSVLPFKNPLTYHWATVSYWFHCAGPNFLQIFTGFSRL